MISPIRLLFKFFIIIFLSLFSLSLKSEPIKDSADRTPTWPRKIFLPFGHVFPVLYMDPTECQTFGGFYLSKEKAKTESILLPQFSFGFKRTAFRYEKSKDEEWDIGLELAAFTQFEWVKDPRITITNNRYQRNLRNIDFKIGVPFGYRKNNSYWRLRFYHTSSHLGDDYMIWNQIRSYRENPNNYEQIDIIKGYKLKNIFVYGGAGLVVRPETVRKRLSFEAGYHLEIPFKTTEMARWVSALDFKSLEQNKFSPSFNFGAGIEIGKNDNYYKFQVLLLYYNGNMPYSVFEAMQIQWIGLGIYFNPI